MNTHKTVSAYFSVIPRLMKLSAILWLILGPALCAQSDYIIGIGDLLDIKVLGVADFAQETRVDAAGTIQMPFIGEVKLQGLTAVQAKSKLADLLDPEYVVEPQVSVIIKEARSRMYSVIGAVRTPNQYPIIQPVTLAQAIAAAGGLDFAKAGDIAQIQRNSEEKPGETYQVEVNLKKLLLEGDMKRDIPIVAGDIINVPVRLENSVYVIGDITKPGPFDYPKDQGIMLTRALAMAGGPTKTSKMKDATLIRQRPDGSMERTPLDVGKILKGQLPDVAMMPNDLLYIPGSVEKSLAWSLLQQIPALSLVAIP